MLPPIIGNINSNDILTLYNSDNGDDRNMVATRTVNRGRYAEIGVRRSDVFLEPYLQQHETVQVVSPSTPPSNSLQHQATQLHHVQSEESLSEESATSEVSSRSMEDSGSEVACDISLLERLIRSHPIWFLPDIQRAGAFHLLQGKEEGNFVVRQSSHGNTMALSVRLPVGKGPYIEHYLIQANKGKLSLETSENRFENIPSLIAHYSQCCDELPVQLSLPRAMREAKNRQQLSSLALLGQEFWRYPMANPKQPESSSSNTSSLGSFHGDNNGHHINKSNNVNTPTTESIVLNLAPILFHNMHTPSPTNTVNAITSKFVSSLPRQPRPTPPNTLDLTVFNEPLNNTKRERILSSNDKLSHKLISPNLVQSVRCPSPVVYNVENNILNPRQDTRNFDNLKNTLDTSKLTTIEFTTSSRKLTSISTFHQNNLSCLTSPELADSRNIITENQGARQNMKTPPPPPPRWAKSSISQNQNNFTVTTTVTFNMNQGSDLNTSQQNTPSDPNTSLLSPQSDKSLNSNFSIKSPLSPITPVLSPTSKLIPKTPNVLSPITPSSTSKSKKRRDRENRKNSQHYQESDILNSYYCSSPADKISDYEDIWNTTDQSTQSTWNDKLKNNRVAGIPQNCVKNSNDRLMSPKESESLINEKFSVQEQMVLKNDGFILKNDKMGYKEMTNSEFSSFKPVPEMKSPEQNSSEETDIGKQPDLLSRVCSANSLNSPRMVSPPRNKLGLVLAKSESNSPQTPESKQSSPFYAEPADTIVQNVIIIPRRRLIKNNLTMNNYRHSEPSWLQTPTENANQLHSINCWEEPSEETEDKTPLISSSVDNLAKRLAQTKETKKIPRAKPIQPPKIKTKVFNDTSWAVDSSWEFIGVSTIVLPGLGKFIFNLRQSVNFYILGQSESSVRFFAKSKILFKKYYDLYFLLRNSKLNEILSKIVPPSEENLERILKCVERLQKADSPLDKLEHLLAAISAIFNSVKEANLGKHIRLSADDLLPLVIWVLIRGKVVDAEVEAEYMWGLLHASLLSGEGGYYLTTLSSAVHVLKTFKSNQSTMSTLNGCGTPDCSSVLRILVPDELHGSLNTRTLPVRPNMNTREVCRILAHKIRCTNPQDYGLFKLVQGEETLLGDHECPQELSHCLFAYKRIDAKIAWPKTSS
ncbi:Protein sprint [Cyphomyrmex costatus]|uniref:Protein sprint n=1 Tax=Cyphomyrmex costatus TaxID=456900 RepID=A0A195D216_9HYME|nr:Protein sprint [Cyphomyrmex costatus]